MNLAVETEQEADGRWIAEIFKIPGVLAYGDTRSEAISRVEALALRVLADRLEHGEMPQEVEEIFSIAQYKPVGCSQSHAGFGCAVQHWLAH